jgi:hypothetical protein
MIPAMTSHALSATLVTSVAAAAFALTACSGSASSGEVLTATKIAEQLEQFDCTSIESAREQDEEGNAYSVVTCELGSTGGIVVNVVDSVEDFTGVRALACTSVVGNDEAANFDVAFGDNWVGLAVSTSGIGVQDLADALGGKVGTLQEFCS